ncbi:bifunctional 2-polyprenyl-6-hydroxyphenol methylase/3-demethylubiquinol 3-O-methyltransferase UbiG [Reyranella sp. CPCC 100927]|uniref:class I SAM-dependent methyltransferase n=1 Tax=Reyranella sp. CPCC 100927 TaxID=2599616 RepID=UPI0011B64623|nr:class I SAM-dependent methyltransferase [Reyranella sp. CPCC 100927]TWT12800.1 class I SAM-dependent methyltransferase [Reyranella sp. CPCC 100927]
MTSDVLRGYADSSAELIPRFEAISSADLFKPVADILPGTPSRVADIGAGTGRDAAWFAQQGHDVLAVEPVDALRLAGMERHRSSKIRWLNDRLPALSLLRREPPFDLLIVNAVWQHLDDAERRIAVSVLADMTGAGGLLILSLRHGIGAPNRPVHAVRAEDTLDLAATVGFRLLRQQKTESMQPGNRAAGVYWTWLALRMS